MYDATGVIGLRYNNSTYLFEKTLQGDIIGIVDSNNERVATYEYDSWGRVLSIKDSEENEISNQNHVGIINPFRYRGYYYDSETGLYYLNSRYYNPEWCRFINADAVLEVSKNLLANNIYIYCVNNPINLKDSYGNSAVGAAFGLDFFTAGAGVSAGSGIAGAGLGALPTAVGVGLGIIGILLVCKPIFETIGHMASAVLDKTTHIDMPEIFGERPRDKDKVYQAAYIDNSIPSKPLITIVPMLDFNEAKVAIAGEDFFNQFK